MVNKGIFNLSPGWFYGIFSSVSWGISSVLIKLVDFALPSTMLVGIRYTIGTLTIGDSALRKPDIFKNAPWFSLFILAVIGAGMTDFLFVEAVRKSGAIVAIMLARVEIPIGVILAHLVLREKVNKLSYLAALIALSGVWLISYKPDQAIDLSSDFYIGVIYAVLTAILWASSGVYAKYLLSKGVSSKLISLVRTAWGAVFGIVMSLFFVKDIPKVIAEISLHDWIILFFLGSVASGIAFLAYYKSLKLLDAYVAAIILSVSIAVSLFGGIFLGEKISLLQWLGVIFIIISIIVIRKSEQLTPASLAEIE